MTFWRSGGIAGVIACLVVLTGVPAIAQEEKGGEYAEKKPIQFKVTTFGMTSYEFGQIVKGQYAFAEIPKGKLDHYWTQLGKMMVGLSAERKEGLRVILAGEGLLSFPYVRPGDGANFGYEYLGPRFKYHPHHMEGSYTLKTQKSDRLLYVGLGYFPYKYNQDSRNLGDYFFRVNPYPQYLPTRFDFPYTRLFGLHIGSNPVSTLKLDGFLTSEVYLWPLRDYSLSLLASYKLFQVAELGAGIMGCRILSVDDKLTTPSKEKQSGNEFSFRGTKVMARLAVDIKHLLPFNRIFGSEDGRLYSELCLNGLKNYPVDSSDNSYYPGYDKLSKRTILLLGFNIPAFKLLDVLSIEVEYWNNDFANSYWGVYPTAMGTEQNPNPWKYADPNLPYRTDKPGGPWHWSVYMKRTLFDFAKLILQFSRDHTVIETTVTGTSNGDAQEAMDGRGNWMWMGKIEFGFNTY